MTCTRVLASDVHASNLRSCNQLGSGLKCWEAITATTKFLYFILGVLIGTHVIISDVIILAGGLHINLLQTVYSTFLPNIIKFVLHLSKLLPK